MAFQSSYIPKSLLIYASSIYLVYGMDDLLSLREVRTPRSSMIVLEVSEANSPPN